MTGDDFKKIAKANVDLWLETLLEKDPEKIAELYSENSTFLPTVSGEFKRGQAGAKSYFEHFLAKNPKGEVVEEEVQALGDDAYLHSGMYNFELDGEGGRNIVQARFSYVWQKIGDNWKVIHHHSSIRPQNH